MARMNNHSKLTFALEHIAHLEDLFKDNADGALLGASLRDIKIILERQFDYEQEKRKTKSPG